MSTSTVVAKYFVVSPSVTYRPISVSIVVTPPDTQFVTVAVRPLPHCSVTRGAGANSESVTCTVLVTALMWRQRIRERRAGETAVIGRIG